jgi:hypothetical protein
MRADVLDGAGGAASSQTCNLTFTLSEPATVGRSSSSSYSLWSGFTASCWALCDAADRSAIPDVRATRLHSPAPNPFNPSTTIKYDIASATNVRLLVYDIRGRKVKELDSGHRQPGFYTVHWDGRDTSGRELSSGLYYALLITGDKRQTQRLVLLK